jgi:hypothetical protein
MFYWFHVLNFPDYLNWFGLDFATILQYNDDDDDDDNNNNNSIKTMKIQLCT